MKAVCVSVRQLSLIARTHFAKGILHAKQTPTLLHLSQRFHSILFFATPHTLETTDTIMVRKILKACNTTASSPSPNIVIDTKSLQAINNEFETCSQDLRIHVFYEDAQDALVPERCRPSSKPSVTNSSVAHLVRSADPIQVGGRRYQQYQQDTLT